MTTAGEPTPHPEIRTGRGAAALGAAFAALGAYVLFEAVAGPASSTYARVGPGFFPAVVGSATILAGLCLVAQALRGRWALTLADDAATQNDGEAAAPERDLPALARLGLLLGGLLANLLLLQPLGFVLASAVLYVCATCAFGSRTVVRNALIGLVFAGVIHLVFLYGLGLALPTGRLWS